MTHTVQRTKCKEQRIQWP